MTADLHPPLSPQDAFGRDFWRRSAGDGPVLGPVEFPIADMEFRLLVEHLPTLCWIARSDGYIVWYNRRWHDYCGTTPQAMEGWGWESVHDPAELPRVKSAWKASIATGDAFEMVFPLRGADGRLRPFLTRISPLRGASGEVVRWFGVNTEIGAQVQAELALSQSEATFDALSDAMPQMVWSARPDGFHETYNARWYEFTGATVGSTDGEAWAELIHPDDRARALDRWRRSIASGEPYEVDYRLRHHGGEFRWTLARALPVRTAQERITRWIGACTDIHDAKMAAERNELLSRELSHRIKNIFAVIAGLIGLSARRDPAVKPYAKTLSDRIAALGRAHEFARPHSEESRPAIEQATLLGLLDALLSPYPAHKEGRLQIAGDDADIDDRAATPLALIIHELATNAAKYGALSTDEGQVDIESRRNGEHLTLCWRERGGPPISGEPTRQGFGAQLAVMSVEQQLGGRLTRTWTPEGLSLEMEVRLCRLSREALAA